MKQNVVVYISALHPEQGDEEAMEMAVPGTLLEKGDTRYISYEECDEEGNVSLCRLKVSPTEVSITKSGGINTQMFFKEGESYETIYKTPLGEFDTEIITKTLRDIEEDAVVAKALNYELRMNGSFISNAEMVIKVKITE